MCKINQCGELDCPANDGKGTCKITTCALIDPEQAILELKKKEEETIVCALCGKPICRSEKTIGLLTMHYKLKNHQRLLRFIEGKTDDKNIL